MSRLYYLFFVFLFLIVIGCESINRQRRISYVQKHPALTPEQEDLLLKGKLWVGMTKEQILASLGSPYNIQKGVLGEKEVWSYRYKDQYTTHRDYLFDRMLTLEILEERLADWRED